MADINCCGVKVAGTIISPPCGKITRKLFSKSQRQRGDKGGKAYCRLCDCWRNRYRLYSMTKADFEKMLSDQEGECAICETQLDSFGQGTHIDHDHKTNLVRGLLCGNCNTGIGKLGDTAERALRAANYILKSDGAALEDIEDVVKDLRATFEEMKIWTND